jgi:SAM-dependent methyltransferase
VCPRCRGELRESADALRCASCERSFPIVAGVARLRLGPDEPAEERYLRGLRGTLRRYPRLYSLAFRLLAPVLVTGPDAAARLAPLAQRTDDVVLDVGAGNDRRHPRFVNVDTLGYPEVDVVADAEELPFREGSVAGLLSIATLEHVRRSERMIAEAHRVLRGGGRLFLAVPFLQPFHAAPHDYRRWTVAGLREELEHGGRFRISDQGVYCGPASALVWLLAEWVALLLSLGFPAVRRGLAPLLQALFSPLKWLDLALARLPGATDLASVVYVQAEKLEERERQGSQTPSNSNTARITSSCSDSVRFG